MTEAFDTIIVGGGPAALSAAIYTGRAERKTLILERQFLGGQVAQTHAVDNYPGFPEGIDGPTLIERMTAQAQRFGAEVRTEEVLSAELDGLMKVVKTSENTYRARTLILAMGADPRKLGVPGEALLRGKGVSYCGTCDAPFFRNKKVVVVGGGDTALKEALFLTKFASHVTLVHRRREFRAERIYQTEVRKDPKIVIEHDGVVESINGGGNVENVDIRNVKTQEKKRIPCEGIFIFVGTVPNTGFLCNLFGESCGQHLETDLSMMTNVPGVYAIGDVRKHSFRQIATAVGEGATAGIAADDWIADMTAKGQLSAAG